MRFSTILERFRGRVDFFNFFPRQKKLLFCFLAGLYSFIKGFIRLLEGTILEGRGIFFRYGEFLFNFLMGDGFLS